MIFIKEWSQMLFLACPIMAGLNNLIWCGLFINDLRLVKMGFKCLQKSSKTVLVKWENDGLINLRYSGLFINDLGFASLLEANVSVTKQF